METRSRLKYWGTAAHHVSKMRIASLMIPVVAVLFFLIGYFDFFEVAGIRLLSQATAVATLAILSPPLLLRSGFKAKREPLFLLAVAFFLVELLIRQSSINATLGMGVAAVAIAILYEIGGNNCSKSLKCLIVIASLFSVLACLQFIILLSEPSLIEQTINPNYMPVVTDLDEGQSYGSLHPIAYLGMTTGQREFIGIQTARMHGFAREPGLLLMYAFLPGLLALTFPGKFKIWAIPLFLISMLGFTMTVYVSALCGLVVLLCASVVAKRFKHVVVVFSGSVIMLTLALLLFQSDGLSGLLLTAAESDAVSAALEGVGIPLIHVSGSIRVRTEELDYSMQTFAGTQVQTGHIPGTVGFLTYAFLKAHVVGAVLAGIFLIQIFKAIGDAWIREPRKALVFALLSGIYIQIGSLQQYGFTLPAAFILNALVLERLRLLASRVPQPRIHTELSRNDRMLSVPTPT